jgi:predicted transcriptional regulator
MDRDRRRAGALEREVLAALVAADRPLTPAEVLDGLGDDLAYTTVMTALTRLHRKGLLARERVGRAYAYTVAADTATHTARQMRKLLDADGDRASALARFVEELGKDDERLLARMLQGTQRRRR